MPPRAGSKSEHEAPPQVRAGSLQELVYKQGQAGVTKASVSIVFDNSDPSRSPVGYEDKSEITVTRQAPVPAAAAISQHRFVFLVRCSKVGSFAGRRR